MSAHRDVAMAGRPRLLVPTLVLVLAISCAAPVDPSRVAAEGVGPALAGMLRAQESLPAATELAPARARRLRGRYASADRWVELYGTGGRLQLRADGIAAAPLVADGDRLAAVTVDGRRLGVAAAADGGLRVDGDLLMRLTVRPDGEPDPPWRDLIGHYAAEVDGLATTLVLHERRGRPYVEIGGTLLLGGRWAGDRIVLDDGVLPVRELQPVPAAAGDDGELLLGELIWRRTPVGTPAGETFRIEPLAPIDELRAAALAARPPEQEGDFREPDLVAVTGVEPGIRLDIRYAGTDNFMGAVFYQQAAAFLQRPAAEAVARVHRALAADGFGLLIHDAYRPWYVTKMFWDATPEDQKQFVADPADGSRHNRGAAVDLTLYDLDTGEAVVMPGGYDEFSVRSYPDYPGGTSIQRWRRDLLRRAMEAEGFDVYEFEWWHFDHRDWRRYPILDLTFEQLETP